MDLAEHNRSVTFIPDGSVQTATSSSPQWRLWYLAPTIFGTLCVFLLTLVTVLMCRPYIRKWYRVRRHHASSFHLEALTSKSSYDRASEKQRIASPTDGITEDHIFTTLESGDIDACVSEGAARVEFSDNAIVTFSESPRTSERTSSDGSSPDLKSRYNVDVHRVTFSEDVYSEARPLPSAVEYVTEKRTHYETKWDIKQSSAISSNINDIRSGVKSKNNRYSSTVDKRQSSKLNMLSRNREESGEQAESNITSEKLKHLETVYRADGINDSLTMKDTRKQTNIKSKGHSSIFNKGLFKVRKRSIVISEVYDAAGTQTSETSKESYRRESLPSFTEFPFQTPGVAYDDGINTNRPALGLDQDYKPQYKKKERRRSEVILRKLPFQKTRRTSNVATPNTDTVCALEESPDLQSSRSRSRGGRRKSEPVIGILQFRRRRKSGLLDVDDETPVNVDWWSEPEPF